MRTLTYPDLQLQTQVLSICPYLQTILYWPLKISQFLGQFPLILSSPSDNQFSYKWLSFPTFYLYINLLINFFLIYAYSLNSQEIMLTMMGPLPLTQTEDYTSVIMTLFVFTADKLLSVYSIVFRKWIIQFQTSLNNILEEIVNEPGKSSKSASLPPFMNDKVFSPPTPFFEYFERERKIINKIGLVIIGLGLESIAIAFIHHFIKLHNPDLGGPLRTVILTISCLFGICYMSNPRLCYFYFILSIIRELKLGFVILKEMVKEEETKLKSVLKQNNKDLGQYENEIGERIEIILELHSKLEKVVRKYNKAFGIPLLICMVISLVLILGHSFFSCVNNSFYGSSEIVLVTVPNIMVPFICFFMVCHNSSQMTLEAQKTIIRLRHFKLKEVQSELKWRVILHYTKAVSNPPVICAFSFTAINYRTVFSAVTVIATYLFILLQLKVGEGLSMTTNSTQLGHESGNFSVA